MHSGDTIYAAATSDGHGARAVVRTSGPEARAVAVRLASDPLADASATSRSMVVRSLLRFAGVVCPAWLYLFPAGRSYNGDETVEYHLPANPILLGLLLRTLADSGMRRAEPGEFTARAYFNGKLDLTQAEGVAAVIAAQSGRELAAARQLMAGELTQTLGRPFDLLVETLALLEVAIDFSDEDVTFLSARDLSRRVGDLLQCLGQVLSGSARFEHLRREPSFALAGRPNAGKSTLLNALAGQERAIISPEAGTTRDALTARVRLPRGWVVVTDVAGVDGALQRVNSDGSSPADQIADAMRRTAARAWEEADFILHVSSVTEPLATAEATPADVDETTSLRVRTKMDLNTTGRLGEPGMTDGAIAVSAKTGAGLEALIQAMDRLAFGPQSSLGERLTLNARHVSSVQAAVAAIRRAGELLASSGESPPAELLAAEFREAADALGAVRGRLSPDDLLGEIFSRFCIGK